MAAWWSRLSSAWRDRNESAALRRRAIPDDLWKRTLIRHPFLQRRDPADAVALRRMTSLFLDRKEFSAAGGLRLNDAMVVTIAAQAVLPVLRLGLDAYDGFVGIVVHPNEVVVQREHIDDDGVVHAFEEVLSGEAITGGPLMLSWQDVRMARDTSHVYNVVIHEFAHVLDMADGVADGIPPLPPDIDRTAWNNALQDTMASLRQSVDQGAPGSVVDPYAAEGPEEFFAVTSETFFVMPEPLKAQHPEWYRMLAAFYRQDPASDVPSPRRSAGE